MTVDDLEKTLIELADHQDPELMIDWFPASVLISGLTDQRFDKRARQIIHQGLFVKLYDLIKSENTSVEDACELRVGLEWARQLYPEGFGARHIDAYIVEVVGPCMVEPR